MRSSTFFSYALVALYSSSSVIADTTNDNVQSLQNEKRGAIEGILGALGVGAAAESGPVADPATGAKNGKQSAAAEPTPSPQIIPLEPKASGASNGPPKRNNNTAIAAKQSGAKGQAKASGTPLTPPAALNNGTAIAKKSGQAKGPAKASGSLPTPPGAAAKASGNTNGPKAKASSSPPAAEAAPTIPMMLVTVTHTVTVSNCVNAAPTGATNGDEVAGAAASPAKETPALAQEPKATAQPSKAESPKAAAEPIVSMMTLKPSAANGMGAEAKTVEVTMSGNSGTKATQAPSISGQGGAGGQAGKQGGGKNSTAQVGAQANSTKAGKGEGKTPPTALNSTAQAGGKKGAQGNATQTAKKGKGEVKTPPTALNSTTQAGGKKGAQGNSTQAGKADTKTPPAALNATEPAGKAKGEKKAPPAPATLNNSTAQAGAKKETKEDQEDKQEKGPEVEDKRSVVARAMRWAPRRELV